MTPIINADDKIRKAVKEALLKKLSGTHCYSCKYGSQGCNDCDYCYGYWALSEDYADEIADEVIRRINICEKYYLEGIAKELENGYMGV